MMWHLPPWAIVIGVLGGVAVALSFKSFRLVIPFAILAACAGWIVYVVVLLIELGILGIFVT